MYKCGIIIPLYKYDLYDYEIMSLKRIIKLYKDSEQYKIMFLCDYNFDIDKLLNKYAIDEFVYSYYNFDKQFFKSKIEYNLLCLNLETYTNLIGTYEYLLIYQLDAYIFDDQLEYWINKDYDYIGGYEGVFGWHLIYDHLNKIFNDENIRNNKNIIIMNGGFSLRKVNYCIDVIQKLPHDFNGYLWGFQRPIIFEDMVYSIYNTNHPVSAIDAIKFSCTQFYYPFNFSINEFKYPFGTHQFQKHTDLYNLVKEFDKNNQ